MSASRSQGSKTLGDAGEEDAATGPLDRSEVLHTGDIVLLKCSLLEEPREWQFRMQFALNHKWGVIGAATIMPAQNQLIRKLDPFELAGVVG
eukprot:s3223_g8.t1